jgi:hypothetical protein
MARTMCRICHKRRFVSIDQYLAQTRDDILDAAAATVPEEPDRISARFSTDPMKPRPGEVVTLTLVAGPNRAGGQRLTIQLAPH